MLRHLSAIFLVVAVSACAANADDGSGVASDDALTKASAPANFVKVRDGLFRGGHPDAKNLDYLKSLGVKRVVDLEVGDFIEAFPWDISREQDDAAARGLAESRYPMSAFEAASSDRFDTNMDEILALLKTATPDDAIYVHCKHGQDRTGLVIGLERVIDEGWDAQKAHDEMVAIGFHTNFAGLEEYFENKAHWEDK